MNEPMRLFVRNGNYHIAFPGGKRQSLRTPDEKTARGIFREMEKEYLRGRLLHLDNTKRLTISELSKAYTKHRPGISKWTEKKDALSMKLLREAIGDIQIRTLTTPRIDEFKSKCLARGARPQTINGYLRHIKAALSYAVDEGYIPKKPKMKMVPVNKQAMNERIVSPADLKKILDAARNQDENLWRYFTVLLWTGARRREALNLTWQDCDFEKNYALLRETKGKNNRRVPLLPPVINALEPVKRDIGLIFPKWHPDTCSHMFRDIAVSCGVNARLHDLRHSAASYMLQSGVPVQVVKEILGHSHLSTTMIYAHVLDDVMAKEIAKMRIE
jgi:integrase